MSSSYSNFVWVLQYEWEIISKTGVTTIKINDMRLNLCELITIYNTVILVRSAIIVVQKLYSTSCQNNSVIGNFMKRLCTCLISMAISRSNKLWNKAEVKIWSLFQFYFLFISIENFIFWNIREPIKTI